MATVTLEVLFVDQIERGRQSRGSQARKGSQASAERDGLAEEDWEEAKEREGAKPRLEEKEKDGKDGRRQSREKDRQMADGTGGQNNKGQGEIPAGVKQTRGGRRERRT